MDTSCQHFHSKPMIIECIHRPMQVFKSQGFVCKCFPLSLCIPPHSSCILLRFHMAILVTQLSQTMIFSLLMQKKHLLSKHSGFSFKSSFKIQTLQALQNAVSPLQWLNQWLYGKWWIQYQYKQVHLTSRWWLVLELAGAACVCFYLNQMCHNFDKSYY